MEKYQNDEQVSYYRNSPVNQNSRNSHRNLKIDDATTQHTSIVEEDEDAYPNTERNHTDIEKEHD